VQKGRRDINIENQREGYLQLSIREEDKKGGQRSQCGEKVDVAMTSPKKKVFGAGKMILGALYAQGFSGELGGVRERRE